MVKKIIDVPDDATSVDINYVKSTELSDYVVGHQTLSVYKMVDAPTVAENATVDKRVIKLPADIIDLLTEHKVKHPNQIIWFLKDFDYSLELSLREEIGEDFYKEVIRWYLGYVDFVPKPSKKYYVQTDLGVVVNNEYNEGNVNLINYDVPKDKVIMTEREADEFVKKLKMLNARKVKVE